MLTRASTLQFLCPGQPQATLRQYVARRQHEGGTNDHAHSIDLILLILVHPESRVDSSDTTSAIPICSHGRGLRHEGNDLRVEVVKKTLICQPNKVAC